MRSVSLHLAAAFVLLLAAACGTRPAPAPVTPSPAAATALPTPAAATARPTATPRPSATAAVATPLNTPAQLPNRLVDFRYAPNGLLLVVTEQSLLLLDTASMQTRWSVSVAEGCCHALALHDDLLVAIAGHGGLVYAWDTAAGQQRYRLEDSAEHFSTLALSPDGQTLATGEYGEIRLWDAPTGQPRLGWPTGDEGFSSFPWTEGITNLAFAQDNQSLFSANWWTGQVMQWAPATGALVSSFVLTNVIRYNFTPDASQLLVDFGGYGFELRDPRTGRLEALHDQIIGAAGWHSFSADGQRVAVWGYNTANGSTAAVWDLATGTLVQAISAGPTALSDWNLAALSPDGRTLALTNEHRARLLFFDIATGQQLAEFPVN